MSAKRNNMIALAAAGLFLACGLIAAEASADEPASPEYAAYHQAEMTVFARDLEPAFAHRLRRIISLDDFAHLKTEENTVILDARSRAAFQRGHLDGAINLPFSDMTLLKLADAIPDRSTRILIYSDANIGEETTLREMDSSALPLNLITFVSLYRHGYFEVFELGEVAARRDARANWQSAADLYSGAELDVLN